MEPVSISSQSACPFALQSTVQRPPAGPPIPRASLLTVRQTSPAAQSASLPQAFPMTWRGGGSVVGASAAPSRRTDASASGGEAASSVPASTGAGPESVPASAPRAGRALATIEHIESALTRGASNLRLSTTKGTFRSRPHQAEGQRTLTGERRRFKEVLRIPLTRSGACCLSAGRDAEPHSMARCELKYRSTDETRTGAGAGGSG
jgi:hypothetical protein